MPWLRHYFVAIGGTNFYSFGLIWSQIAKKLTVGSFAIAKMIKKMENVAILAHRMARTSTSPYGP